MKNVIIGLSLILLLASCVTVATLQDPVYSKKEEPFLELPTEIKRGPGDCAAFATMVNQRRLGMTDPNSPLTQKEWDDAVKAVGTTAEGTDYKDLAKYWQSKGFAVTFIKPTSCQDYSSEIAFLNQGCVIFRNMYNDPIHAAHTEAIYAAFSYDNKCFALTNSWGRRGLVKGFNLNNHDHAIFPEYRGKDVKVIDFVMCPRK